jgi:hypothetical protein
MRQNVDDRPGDSKLRTRTTGFARRTDIAVRELLGKRGTVGREAFAGRRHTAADEASVIQHRLIYGVVVDRPGAPRWPRAD